MNGVSSLTIDNCCFVRCVKHPALLDFCVVASRPSGQRVRRDFGTRSAEATDITLPTIGSTDMTMLNGAENIKITTVARLMER